MLSRFLGPRTEAAYAALRVVAGLMFAFHGLQIVFGFMTEHAQPLLSQAGIGGVIELVTGLLIAIGLFVVPAAFLASGTMAVAYVQFHWKLAFDAKFFPGMNDGELSLLYSFLFLFVACRGAGRFALDASRR